MGTETLVRNEFASVGLVSVALSQGLSSEEPLRMTGVY